ncbi:hypothetical protein ACLOJK_030405 [Asimina triloba]
MKAMGTPCFSRLVGDVVKMKDPFSIGPLPHHIKITYYCAVIDGVNGLQRLGVDTDNRLYVDARDRGPELEMLMVVGVILGLKEELLLEGVERCVVRVAVGKGQPTLLVVSMVVRDPIIIMSVRGVALTSVCGTILVSVRGGITMSVEGCCRRSGDDTIEVTYVVQGSKTEFPGEFMVLNVLDGLEHVIRE